MISAVAFLTVFGRSARPNERTVVWFPVVGAAIGLGLGGIWWVAGEIWPALVAAAVVVAADCVVTGLLHIDGLVDTADGLLPPIVDRERRLAVMTDPAAGAFGTAVVTVVLVLRVASLAVIAPVPLALGALWCASRTVMAVAALLMHYAREVGLASEFLSAANGRLAGPIAIVGMAGAGGLAAVAAGGRGIAGVAAVVLGAAAVLLLAVRRIGGFTGDVLGAAAVIGETVGLLVLAARW